MRGTVALEITIPITGNRLAVSDDHEALIFVLKRLIARETRGAEEAFLHSVAAARRAEAERLKRILAIVEDETPARKRAAR
jgi:hypothetical protein